MERLKTALKRLFCLPSLPTALISVPSFALVAAVLVLALSGPVVYLSYGLSAYALIISVTGVRRLVGKAKSSALVKNLSGLPPVARYMSDRAFRTELSLLGGLAVNLAYVLVKLFSGIYYRSLWFVALAAYYLFLSVLRFLLLQHIHYRPVGAEYRSELRRYRLCGLMLLALNLALSAIVTLVVIWNQGFEYGGYLIYVMAIYTFYVTITSVINVIKYRRYNSPVLSAAKAVSLTAALVSMLSLETAMLAQFGSDSAAFRRTMTAVTGFVVCCFVLGMAAYMIINASRQLSASREPAAQKANISLSGQNGGQSTYE